LKLEHNLREKSAGIYEGQPTGKTSGVARELGIDPHHFRPEGGESWIDVYERIHIFLKIITDNHLKSTKDII
jgi:broad specificity phosphatase PhoE